MRPSTSSMAIGSLVVLATLWGLVGSFARVWQIVSLYPGESTSSSSRMLDAVGCVQMEHQGAQQQVSWSEYVRVADQVKQLERELNESRKQVEEAKQRHYQQALAEPWLKQQAAQQQHKQISLLQEQHTAAGTTTTNNTEPSNAVLQALASLSAVEEDAIWDALHGREFPYRLSCPEVTDDDTLQLLNQTNTSVIIGYHVGMLNNWRLIVRDQLHILHSCGLGTLAEHLFLSYSNNMTMSEELSDLQAILNRYAFAVKTTILYSAGQPVEGTAINAIHQECQRRHPNQTYPPVLVNNNNNATQNNSVVGGGGGGGDTVVFYFHTKGNSRYTTNWRENMSAKFQYPTSLYWRKYMEYFTIERPHVCIEKIIRQNKYACGVYWLPQARFYGGNFWSASGRYLSTLQPLEIHNASATHYRWTAEGWITEQLKKDSIFNTYADKFVVPSNPPAGLYSYLIRPQLYGDYAKRWESWFAAV